MIIEILYRGEVIQAIDAPNYENLHLSDLQFAFRIESQMNTAQTIKDNESELQQEHEKVRDRAGRGRCAA